MPLGMFPNEEPTTTTTTTTTTTITTPGTTIAGGITCDPQLLTDLTVPVHLTTLTSAGVNAEATVVYTCANAGEVRTTLYFHTGVLVAGGVALEPTPKNVQTYFTRISRVSLKKIRIIQFFTEILTILSDPFYRIFAL
jgi:hypothetical protein